MREQAKTLRDSRNEQETMMKSTCSNGMEEFAFREMHVSLIRVGDTVFHDGKVRTVGRSDLKNDGFMGPTLFGDSYLLGLRPVLRLVMS